MSSKRISSVRLFALEAFIAAVDEGDQREASVKLGVARSSISRNITDLELWLGKALLTDDIPRELTSEGKAFLPVAREVVRLLNEARVPRPFPTERTPKVSGKDIEI